MIWVHTPTAEQLVKFQRLTGLTIDEIHRAHWNVCRGNASLFAHRVMVPVMRDCMRRRQSRRAA